MLPDDPASSPPALNRPAHFNFLSKLLFKGFPAKYAVMDASQGWLMFWICQAFSVLGAGFDPQNKQRCASILTLSRTELELCMQSN